MPTRTRVLLSCEGGKLMGSRAVQRLITLASARGFFRLVPPNWAQLTKRDRLLQLAKFLKLGEQLQLFQEPRRTRQSRSLYWKEYNKPRIKPVPQPVYVPVQVAPNQLLRQAVAFEEEGF